MSDPGNRKAVSGRQRDHFHQPGPAKPAGKYYQRAGSQSERLVADEEGHTSRPEIFASGDVVNGARTVVEAVAHSKEVAEAMDQYMQSLKK